jgi:hypothetical protein
METRFYSLCLLNLCIIVDMCLNKSVTKEFPYLLVREHRIAERRLAEPLPQEHRFLVPWKRPFYHSGIQPNMLQYVFAQWSAIKHVQQCWRAL